MSQDQLSEEFASNFYSSSHVGSWRAYDGLALRTNSLESKTTICLSLDP